MPCHTSCIKSDVAQHPLQRAHASAIPSAPAQVEAAVDAAPLLPQPALQAGLLDGLVYR